jgi:hypothetical protein
MITAQACQSKAKLLLIECRHVDGVYFHTAFAGSQKIICAGFDRILSPDGCEEMRTDPVRYVSWCKP